MTTNTESATTDGLGLHGAIMNIREPRDSIHPGIKARVAYKLGCRDMRHAAAELALVADTLLAASRAEVERLREALREIAEVVPGGWHKDDGTHVANSFIHSARAALSTNPTKG